MLISSAVSHWRRLKIGTQQFGQFRLWNSDVWRFLKLFNFQRSWPEKFCQIPLKFSSNKIARFRPKVRLELLETKKKLAAIAVWTPHCTRHSCAPDVRASEKFSRWKKAAPQCSSMEQRWSPSFESKIALVLRLPLRSVVRQGAVISALPNVF